MDTPWVCAFVANRAAWTSSFIMTTGPSPVARGLAATRAAASRFAGPSVPGSVGLRIAPVSTTGRPRGSIKASA